MCWKIRCDGKVWNFLGTKRGLTLRKRTGTVLPKHRSRSQVTMDGPDRCRSAGGSWSWKRRFRAMVMIREWWVDEQCTWRVGDGFNFSLQLLTDADGHGKDLIEHASAILNDKTILNLKWFTVRCVSHLGGRLRCRHVLSQSCAWMSGKAHALVVVFFFLIKKIRR